MTMGDSLNKGLFSTPPYACEDQIENLVPRVPQQSGQTTWMVHGYNQGAPRPAVPNPVWNSDTPIIQPNQAAIDENVPHICGRPMGLGQELECHWPGCTTRVCRTCMGRNVNDLWTLMEAVWLAVCDDCKAVEGRRPHVEYVRRRCHCTLNPPRLKYPGAQSPFCLSHTHVRWSQILPIARPEVRRRRQITFNAPLLTEKKKGYQSTKDANVRRAENQRRTNALLATGRPLGVEVLAARRG